MKRLAILGALVVLLASLAVVAPAAADPPAWTTFEFPGGSLTTSNLNPWDGVNGVTYPVPFNVDAAGVGNLGLRLYVYDLDMSQIVYGGSWGWPPTPDDLGGLAVAGITGSTVVEFDRKNAAWFQLHSALGTENTWEQGAAPWDPVDQTNYRKYLLQAWHRGLAGGKVFPDGPNNHQYNVERHMGPAGRPEPGCAGYVPDPEYDTFDLRIDFTPLGGGQYKMEGWIRLHRASSWDEMICKPHPFKWQWNAAMNNDGQPNPAWIKIGGHMPPAQQYRTISNVDFSAVFPFLNIANWGTPQVNYHTVSWGSVVVEGTHVAPSEVWVDDGWAGKSCGDPADGHTFGYDAFATIQDGIDAVADGGTVNVAAGMYNERLTINKSLDLRGAQYGVDPTATGARTNPANESVITEAGLSTPNPDVLIEIPSGITDVTVDGFTLIGDPTNPVADTSVVRCWDDDITISNNIVDGKYGVLYKGGDRLTAHQNRMVVNKNGVVVQPYPASNVTISENMFNLGSSPAGDESAIYMTACSQCSVTGNTATGFVNGKGLAGSYLSQLTVSGNTFTGNKDAVSVWGNSTYITIRDNDLSSSLRYGISIKGQDVDITGNEITNNGDVGINIARHVIDTERVAIHYNNITGNTNYGVQVDTALVTEIVNATHNWWGDLRGPSRAMGDAEAHDQVKGDRVSPNVRFAPWLREEVEIY